MTTVCSTTLHPTTAFDTATTAAALNLSYPSLNGSYTDFDFNLQSAAAASAAFQPSTYWTGGNMNYLDPICTTTATPSYPKQYDDFYTKYSKLKPVSSCEKPRLCRDRSEKNRTRKEYCDSDSLDDSLIPVDKICEIRKEKILIKSDRSVGCNSISSGKNTLRSKSSDRYLIDDCDRFYKSHKESKSEGCRDNFKRSSRKFCSKSCYDLNSHSRSSRNDERRCENRRSREYNCRDEDDSCMNSIKGVGLPSADKDIVYVPMTKEDFVKKEVMRYFKDSGNFFSK
jgi:hypothetical protein